ncbi:MAG TPA: methyltransferase domain-containing protein [Planktothrix sp.]|jgi:hypothetical protein
MQLRTRRILWSAAILFGSVFVGRFASTHGSTFADSFGLALTWFFTGLVVWMLAGLRRLLMQPLTLEEMLNSPAGRRELLLTVRDIGRALRPITERRYQQKKNMSVLEIGPALTVIVPSMLRHQLGAYTAVDNQQLCLDANRKRLSDVGLLDLSHHVKADVRKMTELQSESFDVAVTCHLRLFASGTAQEQVDTYKELHRVLKPGGELIVFPVRTGILDADLAHELYSRFEPVDDETVDSRAGDQATARVYLRKP